jgi:uncharacterized damage-inducible protein DinB
MTPSTMPSSTVSSSTIMQEQLLYMLWADRMMLKAVREVTPEDLTRDAGVSFGSVLGTMVHILGSQRLWLSRFAGRQVERRPGLQDFPDLPAWIQGWEETASEVEAFLAALTDEQLAAGITWEDSEIGAVTRPLWQPIAHMVNHATYHRGQITSLLRQLGYAPPKTDLIFYFLK